MYNGASRWGQAFDHWRLAVFSFWYTWLYKGVTCFVFYCPSLSPSLLTWLWAIEYMSVVLYILGERRERRGEITLPLWVCASLKVFAAMSLLIVKFIKLIFFTNSVVTSLVRKPCRFKLLNYVTDKIIRVALTTLTLMLTCAQTVCEGERVGERKYVLSVHNKT